MGKFWVKQNYILHKGINGSKKREMRKGNDIIRKIKIILVLLMVFFSIYYIYSAVEERLMPTVMNIAGFKINTVATDIINKAVEKTLEEVEINTDEFLHYNFNEKGELISWGVDTVVINQITSKMIQSINHDVSQYDDEVLRIPIGNAFGNSAFSDWGPIIEVNIMPQGTATIDYDREFVSTGVNQINHLVWLNVEMKMKVIIPLDTKEVIVKQKITLVDKVLSGKIPDSYVVVPEENILDVAN